MNVVKIRWFTWPILLTIVVFIFFGCGCGLQSNTPATPSSKPVEKTSPDYIREIRQATWEAYEKVLKEVRESTFPIDPVTAKERLVLCCKSGQLAAMATAPLTAEGFKIISLCAGLSQAEGWGFPTDKK